MNPFRINELVWAKFSGYPWWPAVIKKEISKYELEIYFCGDDAKAIISKSNIKKWAENFDAFSSNITNSDLLFSIGVALKLQEEEFNFKDHAQFIKNINRTELINEMNEFLSFNQKEQKLSKGENNSNKNISQINSNKIKRSNATLPSKRIRKEYLNKKRAPPKQNAYTLDNYIRPIPKKVKIANIEEMYSYLGKEINEMMASYTLIIENKEKIHSKLLKFSNNNFIVNPDFIDKMKQLVEITEPFITNTFPTLISKVPSTSQFSFHKENPLLLYNSVISIQKIVNREDYEIYINKYKGIYKVVTAILNRINYTNEENTSPVASLPQLEEFIGMIQSNEGFEFQGVKFQNKELMSKYAKYGIRKKIRECLLELFEVVFNNVDSSFIMNAVWGLESFCSRIDKKIRKEYVINIKKIMEVMKEYTQNEDNFPIEKEFNLSTHF